MLIQLQPCCAPLRFLPSKISNTLNKTQSLLSSPSFYHSLPPPTVRARISTFISRVRAKGQSKTFKELLEIEAEADEGEPEIEEKDDFSSEIEGGNGDEDYKVVDEEFSYASAYRGKQDEKDYDRDPELAEILGSCFDDPKKAQSKVEERMRRKRNKILHTKTGSATPMKDVTLICDTIRAWHIIGRLGGCNSMNMQLSQSSIDSKRPRYDAIEGANMTATTFYNIGDLEMQYNLARIWVDIGTSEPLLLDVLVNALTCISFDYVGIKQVVFGGSEFENWKEDLTSEDAGCSTHRI